MFFNGQHVCQSPTPFDATTFDLSTPAIRDVFKAAFEMTVRAGVENERSQDQVSTIYRDVKEIQVNISVTIDPNKPPTVRPTVFPAVFQKQVLSIETVSLDPGGGGQSNH